VKGPDGVYVLASSLKEFNASKPSIVDHLDTARPAHSDQQTAGPSAVTAPTSSSHNKQNDTLHISTTNQGLEFHEPNETSRNQTCNTPESNWVDALNLLQRRHNETPSVPTSPLSFHTTSHSTSVKPEDSTANSHKTNSSTSSMPTSSSGPSPEVAEFLKILSSIRPASVVPKKPEERSKPTPKRQEINVRPPFLDMDEPEAVDTEALLKSWTKSPQNSTPPDKLAEKEPSTTKRKRPQQRHDDQERHVDQKLESGLSVRDWRPAEDAVISAPFVWWGDLHMQYLQSTSVDQRNTTQLASDEQANLSAHITSVAQRLISGETVDASTLLSCILNRLKVDPLLKVDPSLIWRIFLALEHDPSIPLRALRREDWDRLMKAIVFGSRGVPPAYLSDYVNNSTLTTSHNASLPFELNNIPISTSLASPDSLSRKALTIFKTMKKLGVTPQADMYMSLCWAHWGHPRKMDGIHKFVIGRARQGETNLVSDAYFRTLLGCCVFFRETKKNGLKLDKATVVGATPEITVDVLWEDMKEAKIRPSRATLIGFLEAFAELQDHVMVEEVHRLLIMDRKAKKQRGKGSGALQDTEEHVWGLEVYESLMKAHESCGNYKAIVRLMEELEEDTWKPSL
jgi:hypothetical protein